MQPGLVPAPNDETAHLMFHVMHYMVFQQTVIVEKSCKWKEAIDSLKLLYSLVDTVGGKGDEFPVVEMHCKREEAASKRPLPLLFPRDQVSAHRLPRGISSSTFFKPRTTESTSLWVSYRLLIPCMPQAEHLHPQSAFLPLSSVSAPCF